MKYNYNRTDVYGVSLSNYFDWAAGRTAFGAELRNEDLVSGNLGEPLSQTHHISGTDRDYTLGVNRTNISGYLEHNLLLNNFTISAGLVAVKNTWSNMNIPPNYILPFRPVRSKAGCTSPQASIGTRTATAMKATADRLPR
jgi:iron complex outermembrane receptor protein